MFFNNPSLLVDLSADVIIVVEIIDANKSERLSVALILLNTKTFFKKTFLFKNHITNFLKPLL